MTVSGAMWHLIDAEATRAAGRRLAQALQTLPLAEPLVITLNGELGAGKTTLVGGFMQALGVTGPVRSPTYTLLEPYELPALTVLHLDLYRLTDPVQLDDLGLRDLALPRTVFLVEWPDRGGEFFAHPDLTVHLQYASEQAEAGRTLTLHAKGESLRQLVHSLSFSLDGP